MTVVFAAGTALFGVVSTDSRFCADWQCKETAEGCIAIQQCVILCRLLVTNLSKSFV